MNEFKKGWLACMDLLIAEMKKVEEVTKNTYNDKCTSCQKRKLLPISVLLEEAKDLITKSHE